MEEESGYIEVLKGKYEHQKLLLVKENTYLKLKNLPLFYVWEDANICAD